jgi:ethanolamine utilization cobalamin adenosyltransferase
MLYDEAAVRANIRNRDGKRVFFLGKQDTLTPSARDWLRTQRVEILPAEQARIKEYSLPDGMAIAEKPEHMTHLRGNILVPKTSPIIAFRGAMDNFQAEILWAQLSVAPETRRKLDEILMLARNILRWEVMQEPASWETLCGLTPDQMRQRSHQPQQFYGIAHFMPSQADGAAILALNRVRCAARNAELAAARAFCSDDGCQRTDILMLLNRMSSMLYLLMIEQKAKGGRYGQHTSTNFG